MCVGQRRRVNLVRRFCREAIRAGIRSWCRSHQDWSFLAKNSSIARVAVNDIRGDFSPNAPGHKEDYCKVAVEGPTGKHAAAYPFERRSDQGSGVVWARNNRSPDITQATANIKHCSRSPEKLMDKKELTQSQCFSFKLDTFADWALRHPREPRGAVTRSRQSDILTRAGVAA
ncbi:unnamed protein product [Haemonchus placei]|uniref:Transposase n=1 Tax=Haemonchus placei TaxID=6290 RepID=A0A0N4X092_HAEPC|nr:unnamed protein product [Haemonchus placei]